METEKILYNGGPSQVINFNTYLLSGFIFFVACFLPGFWHGYFSKDPDFAPYGDIYLLISKAVFVLPIIVSIYAWLNIRTNSYILTNQKLQIEYGVFSKTTDILELFRIVDVTLVEPFSLRMMGCANIIMNTNDKSTPIIILEAVKDAKPLLETIRKNVNIMRKKRGVQEIGGIYF